MNQRRGIVLAVLDGLHLDLEFVEALAVDAVDIGLGAEGARVDTLDDSGDGHGLDLAAHDQQNLDLMLGVPCISRSLKII